MRDGQEGLSSAVSMPPVALTSSKRKKGKRIAFTRRDPSQLWYQIVATQRHRQSIASRKLLECGEAIRPLAMVDLPNFQADHATGK